MARPFPHLLTVEKETPIASAKSDWLKKQRLLTSFNVFLHTTKMLLSTSHKYIIYISLCEVVNPTRLFSSTKKGLSARLHTPFNDSH